MSAAARPVSCWRSIFVGAAVEVAVAVAVGVRLLARTLMVGLPVRVLQRLFKLPKGAWALLTWGGLRGGISVALALSIPAGAERDVVLSLTYCVVVFSILVQGLTVGRLARATVARCRVDHRQKSHLMAR